MIEPFEPNQTTKVSHKQQEWHQHILMADHWPLDPLDKMGGLSF
jgi:hypothetical protein